MPKSIRKFFYTKSSLFGNIMIREEKYGGYFVEKMLLKNLVLGGKCCIFIFLITRISSDPEESGQVLHELIFYL